MGVVGARQSGLEPTSNGTRRGLGYMWPEAGLVLGLEDLVGLVEDCCRQLMNRGEFWTISMESRRVFADIRAFLGMFLGLKTPLLFSCEALPFSAHRLTNLLQSFTSTLRPYPSQMPVSHQAKKTTEKYRTYVEDMTFAGECEIAWLLRWGLAKVVRVDKTGREGGTKESRGLLDWGKYEDWRGRERGEWYGSCGRSTWPDQVIYTNSLKL